MSAAEKNPAPVRMSCEMSQVLNMRLIEIAENSGLSVSDVMRRAVALVDLAYDAKQKGYRLGIFDANRELITEYTNVLQPSAGQFLNAAASSPYFLGLIDPAAGMAAMGGMFRGGFGIVLLGCWRRSNIDPFEVSIFGQRQQLPAVGQSVELDDLKFEVIEMVERRIVTILVSRIVAPE